MEFIYNKIFLEHNQGGHPESAVRLDYLRDIQEKEVENGRRYLSLIYQDDYIENIKNACEESRNLGQDTYTCPRSFEVACYAVGATVHASQCGDFALVRPPGHHATADMAMGFCLFNNAAIAVQNLVNQGKKVFVLDFDCHYGNGTSEIFYNDPNVLYLSFHQYPFYPGNGFVDEIGERDGKGFNIPIPLLAGTGDDVYLDVLNSFVPLIKDRFKPDIVCVSAGFDAHHADPLGGLNYSLHAYYETGRLLSKNFKRVFATLEGGYDPVWLARCVNCFRDGINNKEADFFGDKTTKTSNESKKRFNELLKQLKINLGSYWEL